jgi:hypothetical protein
MLRLLKKRLTHINPASKGLLVFLVIAGLAFALPVKQVPLDISGVLSATSSFTVFYWDSILPPR